MTHRLLLDTASLLYRAFYALPTSLTDGEIPVNAVRGYVDMTARAVAERRPDEVWHCRDDEERPAARVAAWPDYKAERPPEPADLTAQLPLLDRVLGALGARQASAPGWEADDVIGRLVADAGAEDRIEVVTGDRDLLQLVRDRAPSVRVLFTVRGVSEIEEFDVAAVHARHGVPPERYVDYAILRGDPSDGLPGIAGVGEKTARRLVTSYPDLDALLADTGALSPRLAERLAAAGGYVEAMRAVVPVRRDVDLVVDHGERDDAAAAALAAAHNLDGPVRRLREALDAGAAR